MKISVLSNINIDMLAKKLAKKHDTYVADGYGVWVQEINNPASNLYSFRPRAVFILLDGEELVKGKDTPGEMEAELDLYLKQLENALASVKGINFFISNLDIPLKKIQMVSAQRNERLAEDYWYKGLTQLSLKYDNAFVFDLKLLAEKMGRDEFYSLKFWYAGGIKFSIKAEKAILTEIERYVRAVEGKKAKCIILDLDNTLWGGVVGEAGIEGIELSEHKEGARYKDFQKRLKEAKELGCILAIVSKNNPEDALEAIRNHPDMVLREDDFIAMKINWRLKADNIKELAEELNIGLDSMIFIDDNPVERDSVKKEIPQLIVPAFPEDTAELERFFIDLSWDYLLNLKLTEEDREKTAMYKQNFLRQKDLNASSTYEDFLKSLGTIIKIRKAGQDDIARISQLTQKTNQFNVTTRRYTDADIEGFLSSDGFTIYIAAVRDKYGDNGKVAVVIIRKTGTDSAEIDTFLMSCRVMGRYIEDRIIDYIEADLSKEGIREIKACYIPTAKNKPVDNLFERLGYEIVNTDSGGNKTYRSIPGMIDRGQRKEFGEVDAG